MISLILGADGMVGKALAKIIPNAILGTHENADITDYESLFAIFSAYRPDIVYLAAAITNVDKCENRKTDKTNIAGSLLVARLCEMFSAKFVFFSSGYVFSGISRVPQSEGDIVSPIQNYGHQKTTVERRVIEAQQSALIIRTIGIFGEGPRNKNFVKAVANTVRRGAKFYAPVDQYMNPILASDLADITVTLALKHTGLFHVAGDECLSKFEYARRVAEYFGEERLVEGVASAALDQIAPRPRMACLDTAELGRLHLSVPSFQKGLQKYLSIEYG